MNLVSSAGFQQYYICVAACMCTHTKRGRYFIHLSGLWIVSLKKKSLESVASIYSFFIFYGLAFHYEGHAI